MARDTFRRGCQIRAGAALAWLAVAGAAATFAQQPAKPQPGTPRTIILPPKIAAGLPATLAVLDASGRLVPRAAVILSTGNKLTTDATGRALFVAPRETARLTAETPGKDVIASAMVVDSPNPVSSGQAQSGSEALRILSFPRLVSLHDRFTMEGSGFRGAADSNRVMLAGQPSLVLAASPLALVVLPGPGVPIGTAELRLSVAGIEARAGPITAVLLVVTGPMGTWHVGGQGVLTVRAYGTEERLEVEVRNASPEIVRLSRGNVQRVTTSGGQQNTADIEMQSLAPGDYTVTARLAPAASGLADSAPAPQRLMAAREPAAGEWTVHGERFTERIDSEPREAKGISANLDRLRGEKPAGHVAALLQAAWQEMVENE